MGRVRRETGGRAWVFGDDIDTDLLAPGAYMKGPVKELARHCLEAVDPTFAAGVAAGDVVVGGVNFGVGSSREQAAQALRCLGVGAVVARSFGGIFYRNALNLGLLAVVCAEAGQLRAGDRLTVDFDIDPALEDALVPNLVLQPIVENAVKHGIAPRSAPGRIEVCAWADDGQLRLCVADDGVGLPEPPERLVTGIGLSNVQARLVRLYGDDHHLALRPAHPTGLIVEMTLPLRRVEEEVEAALA